MQLNELFTDFILSDTIDYDYDGILNYINYNREKIVDNDVYSQRGGWQSKKFTLDAYEPEYVIADLINVIQNNLNDTLTRNNFNNVRCDNYWININSQYNYNSCHRHPRSTYSGVLYLQIPDDSRSPIIFYRESICEAYSLNLLSEASGDSQYARLQATHNPERGECLIFPSYLAHEVLPNQSQEERISLSFNFII